MLKSRGNMYSWITDQWDPIAGECKHKCKYCYVKRGTAGRLKLSKYLGETRLHHCITEDLGSGNFIFVGSMTDMWGEWVPKYMINRVLIQCMKFRNKYFFQSKNPRRFQDFIGRFPEYTTLGTTIETNRVYPNMSKAPDPLSRAIQLAKITEFVRTITIEPILDFDLDELLTLVDIVKPEWINIGADSKKTPNLPEPSPVKVRTLIQRLENSVARVEIKPNLARLINE
ncbi:DUF5131 family protein [candidate division WOR-3 bacterium]|nr:DUF5131 family protein [candidate division WOR-3 bacterium]